MSIEPGSYRLKMDANKILGRSKCVEWFGCEAGLTKLSFRFFATRLESFNKAYSNAQ